jgi:hypothetical protein
MAGVLRGLDRRLFIHSRTHRRMAAADVEYGCLYLLLLGLWVADPNRKFSHLSLSLRLWLDALAVFGKCQY